MIRRPPRSTPLSLHDALPICFPKDGRDNWPRRNRVHTNPPTHQFRCRCSRQRARSEEHTSELQSRSDLVCRLLLEKKKNKKTTAESTCTRPTTNVPLDAIRRS